MSQTIQIAIADYHAMVREGIRDYLNSKAHFNVCIEACNGKDLIDKIASAPYQPDICVVDVSMPVMNGYDTVKQLKKDWPYIKAIAITMSSEEYTMRKMYSSGAYGYIVKTESLIKVYDAIISVYDNCYYFPENARKILPDISEKRIDKLAKNILSEREVQFLIFNCQGLTYKKIGDLMCLSNRAVEKYCIRLKEKLHLNSREELVVYALRNGYVK